MKDTIDIYTTDANFKVTKWQNWINQPTLLSPSVRYWCLYLEFLIINILKKHPSTTFVGADFISIRGICQHKIYYTPVASAFVFPSTPRACIHSNGIDLSKKCHNQPLLQQVICWLCSHVFHRIDCFNVSMHNCS